MTENDPSLDDDEYELEPVDPEILELQRKHAERKTREAEAAADIHEVYRQAELAEPISLEELKNFRFSTRHLLIATALLSVVMTLCKTLGLCTGLFVSGGVTVAAGWWFVKQRERRQAAKMEKRRREVEARMTAARAVEDGQVEPRAKRPTSLEIDITSNTVSREQPRFDFSFSLKEFFGAFTAAVVILALVKWMGPEPMALILGLVALAGLLLHANGLDPPRVIILAWWILLLLYLIVGLWAAFASNPAARSTATAPRTTGRTYGEALAAGSAWDSIHDFTLASKTSSGTAPLPNTRS